MADDPTTTQIGLGNDIVLIKGDNSTGIINKNVFQRSLDTPLQEQERDHLLGRLSFHYNDRWKQYMQGTELMVLSWAIKSDAVKHPSEYIPTRRIEYPRLSGTSLIDTFEGDAKHELLILGEPGVGKSVLLLDLAIKLVLRAEKNINLQIPILLSLPSWATKQQPLQEWLAEQLELNYQISQALGRACLQKKMMLLLLDGLDEVPKEARSACIEAITAYQKDHITPIAVCCRMKAYEGIPLQHRLALHTAVVVEQLTKQEVNDYIVRAGERLAVLKGLLESNSVLQTLTTTPLMLSIFSRIYGEGITQPFHYEGTEEEQQQAIFAHYFEHMVERKQKITYRSSQQARYWLCWLARHLKRKNSSTFYIEQLQSDWLPTDQWKLSYNLFSVQILGILLGVLVSLLVNTVIGSAGIWNGFNGLMGGWIGGLICGRGPLRFQIETLETVWKQKWRRFLLITTYMSILVGVGLTVITTTVPKFAYLHREETIYCFGMGGLLLSLLIKARENTISRPVVPYKKRSPWWQAVTADTVHFGLLVGLVIGFGPGLESGLSEGLRNGILLGVGSGLSIMLSYALRYGFVGLLLNILLSNKTGTIEMTEIVVWNAKDFWGSLLSKSHLIQTLCVIFFVSLLTVLNTGLSLGVNNLLSNGLVGLRFTLSAELQEGLSLGPALGLIYWLLFGLRKGLSQYSVEDKKRISPNQGIHRSLHNSLFMGLIAGGLSGVIAGVLSPILAFMLGGWLCNWLCPYLYIVGNEGINTMVSAGLTTTFITGLKIVVMSSLLIASLNGGQAALQHYFLRFLLWLNDSTPWHYVQFLEEATEHMLLIKVGGGYMFIHTMLLDYFATLEDDSNELNKK